MFKQCRVCFAEQALGFACPLAAMRMIGMHPALHPQTFSIRRAGNGWTEKSTRRQIPAAKAAWRKEQAKAAELRV